MRIRTKIFSALQNAKNLFFPYFLNVLNNETWKKRQMTHRFRIADLGGPKHTDPEHWFLRVCRRCFRTWCSGCWPAGWRAASVSAPPTERTLNGTASSAVWTGRRSLSAGQSRRSARSCAQRTTRPTLTRSSRASLPSTPRWARRPVTALTKCLLASATAALPCCSDGLDPVSTL